MPSDEAGSFAERVETMRRIERGERRYSEGSPALQATAYYLDHLLAESVARARAASDLPYRKIDVLISLCGFAAIPTMLTYELLRPSRLVVITSRDAPDSVDLIGQRLIGPGLLRHQDFRHLPVDASDPLDMYQQIARELAGRDGRHAVIDITGGRKVMSAAAALAAWQLNLGLTYVENQFDQVTRQLRHGEVRLISLDNPTTLFGEQELARALEMFRSGAFEAARRRYDEIAERIAVPGRARLMRALAELYRTWCDLDLVALPAAVTGVEQSLRQGRRHLRSETAATIDRQLSFARRLAAGEATAFVVCFYVLGLHYQQLGRHDFAALLFYRTVEACLTARLRQRRPGFDPDDCDWSRLGDPAAVRARYTEVSRSLTPPAPSGPPNKLTLFAAAILLASLDDELARRAGLVDPERLRELRERTWARNKSVLAHGTAPIAAEHTESLRAEASGLLTAYWALHGDGNDIDELCVGLRFLCDDR
ncbi:TIGR02710 family CRISPR-associated CARF protein [Micromonospora sp. WMMD718]|uniref:TIGR02710 family CRISPR-associated CARF protein n=1 Tax=unclassified Micromonospora TaxID=2617518 RepID=UPI00064C2BB3|nr:MULTISPECIES: TIGR02710 family CRISPR-associated CARF protein [unclassified Micromonospora]MDG4752634.1 TIGR02710 family CRISPR-associated CARF protein [Micromonospora sp. WMMD718]